jgi:hypothetical protein
VVAAISTELPGVEFIHRPEPPMPTHEETESLVERVFPAALPDLS